VIKYSIVLVPFPFDDFSASKVRPALCLTNSIGYYDHIVIAFISSNLTQNLLKTDVVVRKATLGWNESGLIVDSIIKLHKIVTIPKTLVKRKLGSINKQLQVEVRDKLDLLFDR